MRASTRAFSLLCAFVGLCPYVLGYLQLQDLLQDAAHDLTQKVALVDKYLLHIGGQGRGVEAGQGFSSLVVGFSHQPSWRAVATFVKERPNYLQKILDLTPLRWSWLYRQPPCSKSLCCTSRNLNYNK